MGSLLTQAFIVEKYGLRLNMTQLAEAIGIARQTVSNQIAQRKFPIKTYVDGGKRWCDYRDLATYFDECRERAKLGG